jgi:hypothetical protein
MTRLTTSIARLCGSLFLILLPAIPVQAINFNGFLQNSAGNPLQGITVFHQEVPAHFSSPSGTDGGFTVPDIPAGVDFHLKFDDTNTTPTYADGYSRIFNRSSDTTASAFVFTLSTPAEIAEWYAKSNPSVTQNPNGGTIRGRVIDFRTGSPLAGAVITFTSAQGMAYPVYYYNATLDEYLPRPQGTFANGRYHIFNVSDGDIVTVTASKPGWILPPITFHTHSGTLNVSVGTFNGSQQLLHLPLILKQ